MIPQLSHCWTLFNQTPQGPDLHIGPDYQESEQERSSAKEDGLYT
jgi:hypothetical protein